MPKVNEILLKLEVFRYATSLDLNMGYSHIRLREKGSNLFTVILPRVKYRYKSITMEVVKSPDIFQLKMNYLFHEF